MFLTDKHTSLLPLHPKPHRHQPRPKKAALPVAGSTATATAASRFEAALAARLRGLLPLPPPASDVSPIAALARLADLLALTLGDAAPALAGAGDAAAVGAHLDAGVALLDACNAIAARLDALRRRRLLARFALHLLSSSSPSTPSSVERARAALADRDDRAPPPALPSLPFDQPRGGGARLSAAARVLVAVNAVSALAASAAAAVLGSSGNRTAAFPLVSSSGGGDFPWAQPFNAVSSQLSTLASTTTSEIRTLDEAVRKLASALDAGRATEDAAREVEARTEELTARLDRLADAVNGVFRAALSLRTAELGSFMVGPADKTRSNK